MRTLEKLPKPAPSVVLLSAIVGLGIVLQQTPLAVTADPPSSVIFPPMVADVVVIVATDVGAIFKLLATNVTSLP